MEGTGDFTGSTTIDDFIAFDQISDRTESIMDGSFGFINDLFTTSSYKNGDSFSFRTFFNDQHTFISGTKM